MCLTGGSAIGEFPSGTRSEAAGNEVAALLADHFEQNEIGSVPLPTVCGG